jgi:hypothetical protein
VNDFGIVELAACFDYLETWSPATLNTAILDCHMENVFAIFGILSPLK